MPAKLVFASEEDRERHYRALKDGRNERLREARLKDPEKYQEWGRNAYRNNREKALARVKDYNEKNEEKIRAYKKEWRKRNPDYLPGHPNHVTRRIKQRAHKLFSKYGMSLSQYEELLEACKGRCPVCLEAFDQCRKKPHVHHNHATGKVRGILCAMCNKAEGLIGSSENARRMADHMEQEDLEMPRVEQIDGRKVKRDARNKPMMAPYSSGYSWDTYRKLLEENPDCHDIPMPTMATSPAAPDNLLPFTDAA